VIPAILISGVLFTASGEAVPGLSQAESPEERDVFFSWSDEQAVEIGKAMRANGRVGGWLDARVIHTEHSYNYKLRATWLTPEVIRASARMNQLVEGMDDETTMDLVEDAEGRGDTVIMVEIDPREGSGIIPREWVALLRPKTDDGSEGAVQGVNQPQLRSVKALSGTSRRDYAYDIFWLVFPLVRSDEAPLFRDGDIEAELVVRIQGKEGRVSWSIPGSIHERSREIAKRGTK
jgi:hypothetical protein